VCRGTANELWAAVGPATLACMADGCRTLAVLWSSAWKEAGAKAPPAEARSRSALRALYMDHNFAPSRYLPDHVGDW
jgi:hypothetical protein